MASASTASPTASTTAATRSNRSAKKSSGKSNAKSSGKSNAQSYEDLTCDHDWETHLPPSPEGNLMVSADYCTECGDGLRLLLDRDGAILAARLDRKCEQEPGQEPDRPVSPSLFILQNGRMEPSDSETCRRMMRDLNHGSEPEWSIAPVPALDGENSARKYRPMGPETTPAFWQMLRQHRWREVPGFSPSRGRHVHDCGLCQARMHVCLDQRGRVATALVELPASRECHYLGDENGVTAVTDAAFYGEEPQRVSAG